MSNQYYGYSVLRENLNNGKLPALRESGLIQSKRVLNFLEKYRRTYEPNRAPHYDDPNKDAYWYFNSKVYVDVVRNEVNETVSKAVQNGNSTVIAHLNGLSDDQKGSKMDFYDYFKLQDVLKTPAFMLNVFGAPGEGKTMTAIKLAEAWLLFHPDGLITTNIESWAELHPQATYTGGMVEMIRTAADHDGPVLHLLDELSSEASYRLLQASGVEQGAVSYFRKFRKEPYNASYIGISHRIVDVAPAIRSEELAYFAFKEGETKKQAQKHLVIYQDQTRDDDKKVSDLCGIGMPEYVPDTNDKATWDWGEKSDYVELGFMDPDEDEDEDTGVSPQEKKQLLKRQKEDLCLHFNGQGFSYADIIDMFPDIKSKSTVSDYVNNAKKRQAEEESEENPENDSEDE